MIGMQDLEDTTDGAVRWLAVAGDFLEQHLGSLKQVGIKKCTGALNKHKDWESVAKALASWQPG